MLISLFRHNTTPDLEASNNSNHREVYEDRIREFENSERHFEESLSKPSIETKFNRHSNRGEKIINDLSIIQVLLNKFLTFPLAHFLPPDKL